MTYRVKAELWPLTMIVKSVWILFLFLAAVQNRPQRPTTSPVYRNTQNAREVFSVSRAISRTPRVIDRMHSRQSAHTHQWGFAPHKTAIALTDRNHTRSLFSRCNPSTQLRTGTDGGMMPLPVCHCTSGRDLPSQERWHTNTHTQPRSNVGTHCRGTRACNH